MNFSKNNNEKIIQGKLKARLRMMLAYDIANATGGMVLSTDNLSEYNMGFWTLCGDVGDFAPIQQLTKGFEIPALARFLGVPSAIIDKAPSDDLGVTEGNTDESQLGATYKEIDAIMVCASEDVALDRCFGGHFFETEHKEEIKAIEDMERIFERIEDEEKVKNIVKRHKNTEFKREGTVIINRINMMR